MSSDLDVAVAGDELSSDEFKCTDKTNENKTSRTHSRTTCVHSATLDVTDRTETDPRSKPTTNSDQKPKIHQST